METAIISLAGSGGREEALDWAAEVLRRGGVVIIPTDTVYGLAADASRREAVERIYRIKRRSSEKSLVRLIADRASVRPWLSGPGPARLLEKFWPGPLTVILPSPDGGNRGFRMPDHDLVRDLIRTSGVELIATSANRSGEPVITSPREAMRQFAGEVDLIIDDGELPGAASTVLDLSVSPPQVLREGPITAADIDLALKD